MNRIENIMEHSMNKAPPSMLWLSQVILNLQSYFREDLKINLYFSVKSGLEFISLSRKLRAYLPNLYFNIWYKIS